eukprot:1224248-Amphidinium_carterae.1
MASGRSQQPQQPSCRFRRGGTTWPRLHGQLGWAMPGELAHEAPEPDIPVPLALKLRRCRRVKDTSHKPSRGIGRRRAGQPGLGCRP